MWYLSHLCNNIGAYHTIFFYFFLTFLSLNVIRRLGRSWPRSRIWMIRSLIKTLHRLARWRTGIKTLLIDNLYFVRFCPMFIFSISLTSTTVAYRIERMFIRKELVAMIEREWFFNHPKINLCDKNLFHIVKHANNAV